MEVSPRPKEVGAISPGKQVGSLLFQRGERWLSGFDSRQRKGARINPTQCGFDSRPGDKQPRQAATHGESVCSSTVKRACASGFDSRLGG